MFCPISFKLKFVYIHVRLVVYFMTEVVAYFPQKAVVNIETLVKAS